MSLCSIAMYLLVLVVLGELCYYIYLKEQGMVPFFYYDDGSIITYSKLFFLPQRVYFFGSPCLGFEFFVWAEWLDLNIVLRTQADCWYIDLHTERVYKTSFHLLYRHLLACASSRLVFSDTCVNLL
jgi:hypothetical protein